MFLNSANIFTSPYRASIIAPPFPCTQKNHTRGTLSLFYFMSLILHFPFHIFHFTFSISHFPFHIFHFTFSISHFPFHIFHFTFSISHFPLPISHPPTTHTSALPPFLTHEPTHKGDSFTND
jgi:hypothetical protein